MDARNTATPGPADRISSSARTPPDLTGLRAGRTTMDEDEFEWDVGKAQSNLATHGVSFEQTEYYRSQTAD